MDPPGLLVASKCLLESSIQRMEDWHGSEVCSPLSSTSAPLSVLGEELTPNLVLHSLTGTPLQLCLSGFRTDRVVCVCQLERPAGPTGRCRNLPGGSPTLASAHSRPGHWVVGEMLRSSPSWLCSLVLPHSTATGFEVDLGGPGGSLSAFVDHPTSSRPA